MSPLGRRLIGFDRPKSRHRALRVRAHRLHLGVPFADRGDGFDESGAAA